MPKRTTEPSRITLVALWLQRCAQTFPMYGKTLADFPDRFNAFRDALSDLGDADINAGFELAIRRLTEFPVPAEIRSLATEAVQQNQTRLAEESIRNQRQIEDRLKDERFDSTDMETRRREFAEMVAEAARKKAIPYVPVMAEVPNYVPPHIAAAKGPEWEEKLRRQADELKRQSEAAGGKNEV